MKTSTSVNKKVNANTAKTANINMDAVNGNINNKLYLAFELSNKTWKLMFGNGIKMRQKSIEAGDLIALEAEIAKSIKHFKMNENVEIHSCYEAGRDGFWLHRYLESQNIRNNVVDSSSIEVNRRYRRAKTDRIDVKKLLTMLIRYINGEQKLWSVVCVPSEQDEDIRRLDREYERLQKERNAHTNRIKSLLALHGISLPINSKFLEEIETVKKWDGQGIPEFTKQEIYREHKRYELIKEQFKELEKEKTDILNGDTLHAEKVRVLMRLKGIGPQSSWVLVFEYFGWRKFNNSKEVGAGAGLAPTPYDSGDSKIEQGISKSGNRRIRRMMTEIAWLWIRYQPNSKISQWFMVRFGHGGKRMRRVGIVAVARKLLIALWKYIEKGDIPEGAVFS